MLITTSFRFCKPREGSLALQVFPSLAASFASLLFSSVLLSQQNLSLALSTTSKSQQRLQICSWGFALVTQEL